ncbi:hypothetical protein T02_9782 [Trichinella nativa]|uniref:Uncharacterized protein n=1 Tax=Trichinella nativa TaxID=6335 RepID=A0A0V1L8T7_9BILA|nr:hypothetical protein T02_9782 [Trichinella nativa]
MEKIVQSICKDVVNAINDDSVLVGKLFGKIEQISGRSRYQAAIFLAGMICMLSAVYNPAVKLLCDLICIVYPVMKTLAEMESIEKSRCKQWIDQKYPRELRKLYGKWLRAQALRSVADLLAGDEL